MGNYGIVILPNDWIECPVCWNTHAVKMGNYGIVILPDDCIGMYIFVYSLIND